MRKRDAQARHQVTQPGFVMGKRGDRGAQIELQREHDYSICKLKLYVEESQQADLLHAMCGPKREELVVPGEMIITSHQGHALSGLNMYRLRTIEQVLHDNLFVCVRCSRPLNGRLRGSPRWRDLA
jgi:hypothetical protein